MNGTMRDKANPPTVSVAVGNTDASCARVLRLPSGDLQLALTAPSGARVVIPAGALPEGYQRAIFAAWCEGQLTAVKG